jgi:hypothetical protein
MKHRRVYGIVGFVAVCLALAVPVGAGTLKCPPDSVKVGNVCIDTYDASVWQIDPTNTKLVKKVQDGKATKADLIEGGAKQLAPAGICGNVVPPNPPSTTGSPSRRPATGRLSRDRSLRRRGSTPSRSRA